MGTRKILDEFVEEQGWDDNSIITLLSEFIDSVILFRWRPTDLRHFLQAQAELENAGEKTGEVVIIKEPGKPDRFADVTGKKARKVRPFTPTRFGTCRGCNAEETELQRRAGEYLCISCYLFNEHMAVNPDCESCKAQTCKFISGDATNDDL